MSVRLLIWGGLALVALSLAGLGAWIMRLPPTPATSLALPVAQDEMDAMLTALRPPKRTRPLIAIVGINDATETTDYLMPTGILRRADIADVVTLATQPGNALSSAHGRARCDDSGLRRAPPRRRRLCDRPRHEPR